MGRKPRRRSKKEEGRTIIANSIIHAADRGHREVDDLVVFSVDEPNVATAGSATTIQHAISTTTAVVDASYQCTPEHIQQSLLEVATAPITHDVSSSLPTVDVEAAFRTTSGLDAATALGSIDFSASHG